MDVSKLYNLDVIDSPLFQQFLNSLDNNQNSQSIDNQNKANNSKSKDDDKCKSIDNQDKAINLKSKDNSIPFIDISNDEPLADNKLTNNNLIENKCSDFSRESKDDKKVIYIDSDELDLMIENYKLKKAKLSNDTNEVNTNLKSDSMNAGNRPIDQNKSYTIGRSKVTINCSNKIESTTRYNDLNNYANIISTVDSNKMDSPIYEFNSFRKNTNNNLEKSISNSTSKNYSNSTSKNCSNSTSNYSNLASNYSNSASNYSNSASKNYSNSASNYSNSTSKIDSMINSLRDNNFDYFKSIRRTKVTARKHTNPITNLVRKNPKLNQKTKLVHANSIKNLSDKKVEPKLDKIDVAKTIEDVLKTNFVSLNDDELAKKSDQFLRGYFSTKYGLFSSTDRRIFGSFTINDSDKLDTAIWLIRNFKFSYGSQIQSAKVQELCPQIQNGKINAKDLGSIIKFTFDGKVIYKQKRRMGFIYYYYVFLKKQSEN